MPEHMPARLRVHLGLELETVLQSIRALCGRSLIDAIEPSLDVRKSAPYILAQDKRQRAHPSPRRHIRDRVMAAEYVGGLTELRIEDTVVSSCLVEIPIDRVIEALGSKVFEMHGLSGIRTDAGSDEHHPREKLRARGRCLVRQEFSRLFGQVQKNRIAVEYAYRSILYRRGLVVGIDGGVLTRELLAPAGVDWNNLIGQARFFEEKRDFGGIGRGVIIEFEHGGPCRC